MFLNYLAGALSLLMAVSAFIPWVKVWFYSLKGIDSFYGIVVLIAGLMGIAVAIFQHLAGKIRGRAFMIFSLAALVCEGIYIRNMAKVGTIINDVIRDLTDIFGDKIMQKLQALIGEVSTKILTKLIQRAGIDTGVSGFDFVGNGLILATIATVALLVVSFLIEKGRSSTES